MEPESLGIEPSRFCGPKKCPILFYYLPCTCANQT